MDDRNNLALLNEALQIKDCYDKRKVKLDEIHTKLKIESLISTNQLVNEHNRTVISYIHDTVVQEYFYDDGELKIFNNREEVCQTYLTGLQAEDPNKIVLHVLDEKICAPYYETFNHECEQWAAAYSVNNGNTSTDSAPSLLANPAIEGASASSAMPLNPIDSFRGFMEAKGYVVDETKVNAIAKKHKLGNLLNTRVTTVAEIHATNIETTEQADANEIVVSVNSIVSLSNQSLLERDSKNWILANVQRPQLIKPECKNPLNKVTPSINAQTAQQISISSEDICSTEVFTSGFAATALEIKNFEWIRASLEELQKTPDYKMAYAD